MMSNRIDNYINILQERRKQFTPEELESAERMDEMMRMDGKIEEFRDRVMRGDKEALAQIEDVMKV